MAAGFVGYFGRFPARILIDKITGSIKNPPEKSPTEEVGSGQVEALKNRQKIEKKKAKQAAKIAKKLD